MQPMIPHTIVKRFAISPCVGCSEGLVHFSSKNIYLKRSPTLHGGAILFSCAIFQHVAEKTMARPNDLLQSTYSMYCVCIFSPFNGKRGHPSQSHCPMNLHIVFELNQRRSRFVVFRCLDRDYLVSKTYLLERFHHHLVFESVSPNTVRDFLGLPPGGIFIQMQSCTRLQSIIDPDEVVEIRLLT